jgi:hypothetical protein
MGLVISKSRRHRILGLVDPESCRDLIMLVIHLLYTYGCDALVVLFWQLWYTWACDRLVVMGLCLWCTSVCEIFVVVMLIVRYVIYVVFVIYMWCVVKYVIYMWCLIGWNAINDLKLAVFGHFAANELFAECHGLNTRQSDHFWEFWEPILPSVFTIILGKVNGFAKCNYLGTRQSRCLCQVPGLRHSAKQLALPSVIDFDTRQRLDFTECLDFGTW